MNFLIIYFPENEKEKLSSKDSSFWSNLKSVKIYAIFWQPKFTNFLQSYLLAISNVLHFSTKKESVIILEMKKFWRKSFYIFHENTFLSCTCWQEDFFSRVYRDGIENNFHDIWRVFPMVKINHRNSNF